MGRLSSSADRGVEKLIQEIRTGEYKRDTLPNSALDFTGEQEALYFSNMRKNLHSDLADIVINHSQSLKELELLKKWEDADNV